MIAGIDLSTRFVDVVFLDEDTDFARWERFELSGQDAFDRARSVRAAVSLSAALWDDVLAVGIEDPRGYGAGSLYRVQGAILSRIPHDKLVYPWIPSQWRTAVGLKGNATKADVARFVQTLPDSPVATVIWPQDACDAYCIALATRTVLEQVAA